MKNTFFSALLLLASIISQSGFAQTGCPGCLIDLPTLPNDTIYVDTIPSGTANVPYDGDLSFRMPVTTTPVSVLDPSVPSGLAIDKLTITSVTNLPPGLSWEASQLEFDPAEETDGCIKICGFPLVPGMYLVEINISADILFFSQSSTFNLPMYIAPSTSTNSGFTMTNNISCGRATVSFENNLPSNGQDGYSYFWDFGNGSTSINENPFDQEYTEIGTYLVDYTAVIDTIGYVLSNVTITDSDCDDLLSAPDHYITLIDPNGNEIFTSESVSNTNPPISFGLNITMEEGNYTLEVRDSDGFPEGDDDFCGAVNFNQLSNGALSNNNLGVTLTIIHPVDTVTTQDTVFIHSIPEPPIILTTATEFCEGETLVLASSAPSGNQWWLDSIAIDGAVDSILAVTESGSYQVITTTAQGCSATSDSLAISILFPPESPVFVSNNNLLELLNDDVLPDAFSLQWYLDGNLLADENGTSLCINQTGSYTLELLDEMTGCASTFESSAGYNPDVDCTVGTKVVLAHNIEVFPNPTSGLLSIRFVDYPIKDIISIQLFNNVGNLLQNIQVDNSIRLEMNTYPSGIYYLNFQAGSGFFAKKIFKK